MIKKIQLRGISRSPSDRMTEDGGVAECLNLQLQEHELAPILPPEEATNDEHCWEKYGIPPETSLEYEIVYIHAQNDYRHMICKAVVNTKYSWGIWEQVVDGQSISYEFKPFLSLDEDSIVSISAIGNTLVLFGKEYPYYVLWQNKEYTLLGTTIPSPKITIHSLIEERAIDKEWSNGGQYYPTADASIGETQPPSDKGWALVYLYKEMKETKGFSNFCIRFIRYALRLFDGSYIKQSVPILIGKDYRDFYGLYIMQRMSDGKYLYKLDSYSRLQLRGHSWIDNINLFTGANKEHRKECNLSLVLSNSDEIIKWGDIIQGIDFFVSENIIPEYLRNHEISGDYDNVAMPYTIDFSNYETQKWGREGEDPIDFRFYQVNIDGLGTNYEEQKALILEKGNFYKILRSDKNKVFDPVVSSCSWEDLAKGVTLYTTCNQEELVNMDELADDYDSNTTQTASDSLVFNQRLFVHNIKQYLDSGYGALAAPILLSPQYERPEYGSLIRMDIDNHPTRYRFKFDVYEQYEGPEQLSIPVGDFATVVSKSFIDGGAIEGITREIKLYRPGPQFTDGQLVEKIVAEYSGGWLAYPHPNCRRVVIEINEYPYDNPRYVSMPMYPHPKLNCSYLFIGLGKELKDVEGEETDEEGFESTGGYLHYGNKLLYTNVNNPFLFPVSNRVTFDSNIRKLGVATRALSPGQLGQFDIYAFTETGIIILKTNDVGEIISSKALARDTIEGDAFVSLDQSIVFGGAKGVMLLMSSDINNLSPFMIGRQYEMEPGLQNILSNSDWSTLLTPASDTRTFLNFIKGAKAAYDFRGERVLFFNPTFGYAWNYMLGTKTWHKIVTPANASSYKTLNSYPDCLIDVVFTKEKTVQRHVPSDYRWICRDLGFNEEHATADRNIELLASFLNENFEADYPSVEDALKYLKSCTMRDNSLSPHLKLSFASSAIRDDVMSAIEVLLVLPSGSISKYTEYAQEPDEADLYWWELSKIGPAISSRTEDSLIYGINQALADAGLEDYYNPQNLPLEIPFADDEVSDWLDILEDRGIPGAEWDRGSYHVEQEWRSSDIEFIHVAAHDEPVTMLVSSSRLLNYSTNLTDSDLVTDGDEEEEEVTSAAEETPTESENESEEQEEEQEVEPTPAPVNTVKGLVISRPFDLGEPDVRKCITHLRVRGKYNKGDVKCILLASMDGIHWQRLPSLRCGSYKLFRIAIVTDLAPTERISWVDVEYEPRLTNKMR